MKLKFSKIFFILLMGNMLQATTLTLTTKYGVTGGLSGNFNEVGNQVNGRNICTAVNTNDNTTPGCDMSGDAEYNDNGTGDPSDDYYTGDLLVRTNDSFEVKTSYSWLGEVGKDNITLTGTLPSGTGFIWDGISGLCDQDLSSISEDKKTIVCVRKDFDQYDTGSYSEVMTFNVKVEGDAPNGSKPGDISFTLSEETNSTTPVTDGVVDGKDSNKIVITSSPRWNIDGHNSSGYYNYYANKVDDNGNDGWEIWYNFTIEVDEVDGETDDNINPTLGNEALKGGRDATISFTTDLSTISPNAKLVTWDTSNSYFQNTACTVENYINGDEPYASLNTSYPTRSIATAKGVREVTCLASGQTVTIEVKHMDGTLIDAPIQNIAAELLPVNRKIATIGLMRVFVPFSDVELGEDGIKDTADDNSLITKNCYDNFNPLGISDNLNFGGEQESKQDNCYQLELITYIAQGDESFHKSYRAGWSDEADQKLLWNKEGENRAWYSPPTDATSIYTGDGIVTPGDYWGSYVKYSNSGDFNNSNAMMCDVIDTNTFSMELLDPNTDNPDTSVDDRIHAVDLDYSYTKTIENLKIEYAVGYIGDWPPNPNEAGGYAVAKECNNTSVVWYPDFVEASTHGAVSKVRLSAPIIPAEKNMIMRIKHKARATFLETGETIPNKTLLVNYATYKSSLSNNKYVSNTYVPRTADEIHTMRYKGDRLIMQKGKVRILKSMNPSSVSPGVESTVNLKFSFTNDSTTTSSDNVQVVDVLPKGLGYKGGSTVGTYGESNIAYSEPNILTATEENCNLYASTIVEEGYPCGPLNNGTGEETILVWNLGEQNINTVFNDLDFKTVVTVEASTGTLENYAQIESPADDSPASKRIANANISNSIPDALLIGKSVLTPTHEINEGSDLNWMEFRVGLKNGSTSSLTNLDIIDILPFIGDGIDGSFTFTPQVGTTVDRKREPATNYNGDFKFDSLLFDNNGECDANNISYWFTDQKTLDISPKSDSNTKSDGTVDDIWCEGNSSGPDIGCTFDKSKITAIRTRGVTLPGGVTCFLNVKFSTNNNLDGDIYSNTASSTAKNDDGVILDGILSNTVSARVYASSIGDYIWLDENKDGIQDANESGIDGIIVKLFKDGTKITETTTSNGGKYIFENLFSGSGYVVEVVIDDKYTISSKNSGGDRGVDSDINSDGKTDEITLKEEEENIKVDVGLSISVASTVSISGTIFDDGNGDNTVNGTPIATPSNTQLYVTLLDSNGSSVATKAVAENGTYLFDDVNADSSYTVVLSKDVNGTVSTLPNGWNSADGEHIGAETGLDAIADGKIAVNIAKVSISNVNFGINQQPIATDITKESTPNPGGDLKVVVPTLIVTDKEDTEPTTIVIETLPENGTLYYNETAVILGQVISNFDNSKLMIDPNNGDLSVSFTYSGIDKVGIKSNIATVTIPFGDITIFGHIYNDGDGNGNVNGTAMASIEGQELFVTLIDANDNVVASKKILADGSYIFNGEDGLSANKQYTIVLSTTNQGKIATLPNNWNNADGENVGLTGLDGVADGIVTVDLKEVAIDNVNFGINKKPIADDINESVQGNPGTDKRVTVPVKVSDNEDTTPTTITVTTLPTNAKLYYNGVEVVANTSIRDFDKTKFTVDPDDGNLIVTFKYTTTDRAGTISDEGTVTMPFSDISISGKLFNDGNDNGKVDGELISKADTTQLYVTLVDAKGDAVASIPLTAEGTYSFSNKDGLVSNTTYSVVLSDSENGTIPKLPANWNNADGENIGLTGLDNKADGIIMVAVESGNISEINFGINKKPEAKDKILNGNFNPGKDIKVNIPMLEISDKEDGVPSIITITKLPTNGVLYYNGNPVSLNNPIIDVNASNFSIDPDGGEQVVIFEYTTTDRVGVVSDKATVKFSFKALEIKGHVFHDGNNDGTVNGTAISAPNGIQLYATLTNKINEWIETVAINGDGTYRFTEDDGLLAEHTYHIVLSREANSTTPSLPPKWSNQDGEHIGADAGLDDNANGMIEVVVAQESVIEVNFGINKKPVAGDNIADLQLNPGKDIQVDVPDLNVTDSEDITPAKVTILTVPINGLLYYNGTVVKAGDIIENLDNSKLKLDPNDGDQTVSFTYKTTDIAGIDSDIATISMSFKGLKISGNIFDDGNHDETVNGRKVSTIDNVKLYVTLLDSQDELIKSKRVNPTGAYLFNGVDGIVPNTQYKVILSTTLNSKTASLPTDWNSADGEHIGTDKGLDDTADGMIDVSVVEDDVVEVNFGINKKPTAQNLEVPSQINPAGTATVVIPKLNVTDKEDGVVKTIIIKTLPTEGILYYKGQKVTQGQKIIDFEETQLTIDPNSGTPLIEFSYSAVDRAGVESDTATVKMIFRGISISGNLFNDGIKNGVVNGIKIAKLDGINMYVTLISDDGTVVATKKINEGGSYSFDSSDDIEVDSNYKIVLNIQESATETELPDGWNFVDSEGIVTVALKKQNIKNINFGVNYKPVSKNIEPSAQTNPNGDNKIVVPELKRVDREDGIPTTIIIKTLPTNGILYYKGQPVTEGQIIKNYDKSKLKIDPNEGDVIIEFIYSSVDNAGIESNEATVKMSFTKETVLATPTPTPSFTPTPTLRPLSTPRPSFTPTPTLTPTLKPLSTPRPIFTPTPTLRPLSTPRPIFTPTPTLTPTPTPTPTLKPLSIPRPIFTPIPTKEPTATPTPIPNSVPKAENVETPMRDNPGGDNRVVVDLNVSDKEDGIPTTITITTLPTAGTLYYIGEEVTQMQEIKSFDSVSLELDPDDGNQTVVFYYTATDSEGLTSEPARVRIPFVAINEGASINISDDNVLANTLDPVTTINVLANDDISEESHIFLLNNTKGDIHWQDGLPVGGESVTTTNSILVPGEGTWDVEDGKIIFTAEDGFTGTPTPIYYMVKDQQGNQSNVAQVSIQSPCVCKAYKSDAVAVLSKLAIIFLVMFLSIYILGYVEGEEDLSD